MPSDDMHSFSVNMSSEGEGIFIIWCIRERSKKKATRRMYRIHPCFNRRDELGSFVVVRELDQDTEGFRPFYT
jgi:hypothetical protein